MIFKIQTKFADYAVAVEGESPMECIEALSFLADSPRECPVCGAGLTLYARRAGDKQEYRYYGLRCTNDGNGGLDAHEKTYGQFADGTGLFYKHKDEWVRVGDVRGGQRQEDDNRYDENQRQGGALPGRNQQQPQSNRQSQRSSQYAPRG